MPEQPATAGNAGHALSAVVPNYNHARYLPRALDALLSQSHPAAEIIVVDDCSTDESRDIVARYAIKNPSVRLVAIAKNSGVIAALSRGLNEARGHYVYFGAADDFVMPGFFAAAVEMLEARSSAGLFCGDVVLVDGHSGQMLGVRPPVRPRFCGGLIGPSKVARLLRRNDNFVVTGAAVFRRDAVVWAGGFDENLSSFADGYLVRKIALTYGFCYQPAPMLTWCIFSDSVSRKTSTESDRARRVLGEITARMTADAVFPHWYQHVFVRRWRFSIARLAVQESPINRDLLMDVAGRSAIGRTFLSSILNTFNRQSARVLILAWLWLRFRPFSLLGLGTTALARKWGKFCFKKPSNTWTHVAKT
jgi:glycosyltransferase involved in cell wall biosynthesis